MKRVRIKPHVNWEEAGTVEWSPQGSDKWYPIDITQIFPIHVREKIIKAFKNKKRLITFKGFDYDRNSKILTIIEPMLRRLNHKSYIVSHQT